MTTIYECRGYCRIDGRCVRVIFPGGRPTGYHARHIANPLIMGSRYIQVCPDRPASTPGGREYVTEVMDKACPDEVARVMEVLGTPEGQPFLAWLCATSEPTSQPEGG